MELEQLLLEEEDPETPGPRSSGGKSFRDPISQLEAAFERRGSPSKNKTDLSQRSSTRSLYLPYVTGIFHSRPCCQSWPVRIVLWIVRAAILFLAFSLANAILRPSYVNAPSHYRSLEERVISTAGYGRGNIENQKVYIAANIISENLISGQWGSSLHKLVDLLGEGNVFISIYENDSGKGTQAALRALQQRLKCHSSIVTGAHSPLSDLPKVRLPNGKEQVQRITYLAEIRNQLLRPLDPAHAASNDTEGFRSASHAHFDRILFLNDVYFNPADALQLLFSTNGGDYRAACAVDFTRGPLFYDTFATRDYDGYRIDQPLYPWFAPAGSAISREDVQAQKDAVRVRSCWGGMAAFEASIFRPTPGSESHCRPETSCLPLQFRGSNEPFWEASECCLIFADIEEQHGQSDRVFINPYVRVAYTKGNFDLIPFFRRFERFFEHIQYLQTKIYYSNVNPRRSHVPGEWVDDVVWQDRLVATSASGGFEESKINISTTEKNAGLRGWSTVRRRASTGGFCGERTMFVMKGDLEEINENIREEGRNWDLIPVPRVGIGR